MLFLYPKLTFEELGVKEYEIRATLDSETSEICRSLNGKCFPMEEYSPGSTAPPFHPWCRTVVVPHFDDNDNFGTKRAAGDETEKTNYVPDDMTYEQWEKKYVVNFSNNAIKMRGTDKDLSESNETVHKIIGTVVRNDMQTIENEYVQPFIEKYVKSDYEHMLVVDKNGTVHYVTSNNKNAIDLNSVDIDLEDSYNIHTHPPNQTQFSFSDDADIPAMFDDKTAVMEACDYKYRYRFERVNITFDEWEKVRSKVEDDIPKILYERGYNSKDYEEQAKHILLEETCKRLGLSNYRRWKL